MANDFMNSLDSLDVDEDGTHSPLDVLVIVNDLNQNGARALPSVRPVGTALIDVDGDHSISPLDALVLINEINKNIGLTNGLTRNLSENGGLATEELIHIGTSQLAGSRLYKLKIEADLAEPTAVAVGDLFAVYVTMNSDGSQTLQDRGIESSPIFTMTAHGNEITPGVSMYDGQFLTIDLTAITVDSSYLRLQLLNHDAINVSHVIVTPISNLVDPEGVSATQENLPRIVAEAGPSLDTSKLVPAANVPLRISEVQSDTAGLYQADLAISNQGSAIGRETVIVLKGLPSGVTVDNPSGLTAQGEPYLNLKNAIPSGGLGKDEQSVAVRTSIKNPNNLQFPIRTEILSGQVNRAPSLAPIANISIMPGAVFSLKLLGADLDGDELRYSIRSSTSLPTSVLIGDQIKISPSPTQIGQYQFDVVATDGKLTATQRVNLSVIADPNTTTRLSGKILNVQGAPIVGLRIEVGSQQSLTQTDGSFALNFGSSPPVSDTIRVRADLLTSGSYPFIAEKLALLLEHEVYTGFNNQIERPIFLPTLNVGTTVNPATSQTISQQLAPNEALAAVQIATGTLFNQQGSLYTGKLSITEVPVDRTPAVLPSNISANLIVTIQPGEMTFATPTPITLPNRSKLAPGSDLDLWSINPTTGTFEVVGKGRVSPDGSKIDTIEGGVRFSSWHGFVPPSINPLDETASPQCETPKATCHTSSNVVIYSGEYIEHHEMPSYSSNGVDRSVTLVYSSMRSAPEQIVRFNTDLPGWFNPTGSTKDYLGAKVNITRAGLSYGVSGQQLDNAGNSIVETGDIQGIGRVSAGFQFDMRELPDGVYDYSAAIGAYRPDGSLTMGSRTPLSGQFVKVSAQGSAFGEGWGIAGLQRIISENGGKSLILVDGNGSEFLFERTVSGAFKSPLGDFSVLSQRIDGTFERRMTNGTTYRFDTSQRLAMIADRNGNVTRYEYSNQGTLARIIDPVGMITTLSYVGGRLSEIALPDGRKTALTINANGDLIQIIDPDGSTRRFDYDASHRLVKESTPLGYEEHTEYDVFGRVRKVVRADGSVMLFSPAELKGVQLNSIAKTFTTPLPRVSEVSTQIVMPSGNVVFNKMNRNGLITETRDSFGLRATYTYDANLRLSESVDSKDTSIDYTYDNRGNVTSVSDLVSFQTGIFNEQRKTPLDGLVYDGREQFTNELPIFDFTAGDFNGDSFPDVATISRASDSRLSISILTGDGAGGFSAPRTSFGESKVPKNIVAGDLNGDGKIDLAISFQSTPSVSLFEGQGNGIFGNAGSIDLPVFASGIQIADMDKDGRKELLINYDSQKRIELREQVSGFTFGTPQVINSIIEAGVVIVTEMNNDQSQDLVVLDRLTGNVTSFVQVNGSYNKGDNVSVPGSPSDIAVHDFNRDGFADVAISSLEDRKVRIYSGNGTGSLTLKQSLNIPHRGLQLALIDLGKDGKMDLLVQMNEQNGSSGMGILRNNENEFSLSETVPFVTANSLTKSDVILDINGDGLEDLLRQSSLSSVGGVSILLQNSTGIFTLPYGFSTPGRTGPVRLSDFNNDSVLDVAYNLNAANGSSGGVGIAFGNGLGKFSTPTVFTNFGDGFLATAEFNRDENNDLIVFRNRQIQIAHGTGNGDFADVFNKTVSLNRVANSSGNQAIAVGDFNEDGINDFAIVGIDTNSVASIGIYTSSGNGDFVETLVSRNQRMNEIVSIDFDRDGDLDLVALGDEDSVFVLNGDGTGRFAVSFTLNRVAFRNGHLAVGDINEDGITDFVVSESDSTHIGFYIRNAAGTITYSETNGLIPHRTTDIRLFDLNRDGHLDVVTSEAETKSFSVLLGSGNGSFDPRIAFNTYSPVESVAIGDIDLDGHLDLVGGASIDFNPGIVVLGHISEQSTALLTRNFVYDENFSQATYSKDELGRQTRFQIDPANGNLLSIQRPLGYSESMTYSSQGLLDTYRDALGRLMDYDYDQRGRVTSIISAQGTADETTVLFGYDPIGNVTSITDPKLNVTRFEYDALRRVIKETDAINGVTRYTRDAKGNVLTMTDALERVFRFTYDALSRITSSTDPLGNVTRFAYDIGGNQISVTDPTGNVTRKVYDVANRLIRTIDPDGGVTKFTYDRNDNLLSVTDSNANVTRYFYDERNRMVRELDPLGKSSYFLYDGVNNLIARKDRNDRQTYFTYDALDRMTKERWNGTRAGQYVNTITSSHDIGGNLKSIEDNYSKLAFTYDSLDRVISTSNAGTPNSASVLLSYAYDNNSNRTSVTDVINGVNGATVLSQFDALDRLKQITQTGASTSTKRVDFGFNAIGQYTSIARSNNADGLSPVVTTSFGYDGSNRLSLIDHKGAAGPSYASFGFGYDSASRITRITEKNQTIDFGYDKRDQLVSANYGDTARTDEAFKFDTNGNRVESNAHGTAYRTGPGNRLLTDGVYNYEYDNEGNLTKRTEIASGKTREFQWDHRNRLTMLSDKNASGVFQQVVRYSYDSLGRRISKQVDTTPLDTVDAAIEQYVYDGEDVILDFVDPDGSGPAASTQTTRYLLGPGIDNLLAIESASGINWVLQDHLGSTRALVSSAGVLVQSIGYDSFGKSIVAGSPLTRYLYTGRELDAESGLFYYRARYYGASTGRFTNEDPIGFAGGSWNTQIYVDNSPIFLKDPDGLLAWFAVPLVGAAISAGIELGSQLWQNGGDLDCVDLGAIGEAAALGALLSSFGPGGALFGRSAKAAGKFGSFPVKPGLFNGGITGDGVRLGWGWNKNTAKQTFGLHGGKVGSKSHWHKDWFGVGPGDYNTASALSGGIAGGAIGSSDSGDGGNCGCKS